MRFPSCLLLLCLPAAICAAQNSPRWRFVHPHARVIAGLEWRRALDSPLGRELRREFEKSEFASLEGLDIMTGLEGVLISSPGQNPVRPGDDAPVVIAAEGGFDLNRVRKSVLGSDIAKRTYHGVEMYAPKREGGQRMTLGLVNERVLLFGDVKCLEAAIDRDAALPGRVSNGAPRSWRPPTSCGSSPTACLPRWPEGERPKYLCLRRSPESMRDSPCARGWGCNSTPPPGQRTRPERWPTASG
jgi:hypothetical protein